MHTQDTTSTRPYLIRALYEWCTDNGFTPYVVVRVDASVQVPREYVKDGEIVLNVSYDATSALQLGNDYIEFKARFGGQPREIIVPVDHVVAIYARENGQGMAFPPPEGAPEGVPALPPQIEPSTPAPAEERVVQLAVADTVDGDGEEPRPVPPAGGGGRPALKRVK
ncbi:MAG: ClpXP protease specificity-enhancing factor [Comamonadaceae bacterium]|nr:ClpXP protease specificity-enhancing factor [Comamonadaceae bacterium]